MRRSPLLLLAVLSASCAEPARPGEEKTEVPRQPVVKLVLPRNSGAGQVAPVASYLPNPIVVQVVQDGKPFPGVPIRWATPNPSGRVEPITEISDANGLVSARYFTATMSGEQTALAILGNQWLGVRITALPDTPVQLRRVSAVSDSVAALMVLLMKVRVEDQYGNGVPGIEVLWRMNPANAGGVSFPSWSDAHGIDSTAAWLEFRPGSATVTASIPSLPVVLPVTFQMKTTTAR